MTIESDYKIHYRIQDNSHYFSLTGSTQLMRLKQNYQANEILEGQALLSPTFWRPAY